jgi:hypothetical protein
VGNGIFTWQLIPQIFPCFLNDPDNLLKTPTKESESPNFIFITPKAMGMTPTLIFVTPTTIVETPTIVFVTPKVSGR